MSAVVGSPQFKKPVDGLTVLACDFLTDRVLAELPVTNLKFGSKNKNAENFSFDVVLGDSRLKGLDPIDSTQPVQRMVYIDYQGELVYGGIIWARNFKAGDAVLKISGQEIISWYTAQVIPVNLDFIGVDQFVIARRFFQEINKLQAGNCGLVMDTTVHSFGGRDRHYKAYNRKDVFSALVELSNVIGGFDWAIDVRYGTDNRPEKVLTLSYPRRGHIGAGANRLFDYPGNLTDYSYPEDGTGFATDMMALGVGEGTGMHTGFAENTIVKSNGFPRLDATVSYKTVRVQATLDGHAQADLKKADHLFVSGTFETQMDIEPRFGSYLIGDDARFRLTSSLHPAKPDGTPGLDQLFRISAWAVDGSTGAVSLTAGPADLGLPD